MKTKSSVSDESTILLDSSLLEKGDSRSRSLSVVNGKERYLVHDVLGAGSMGTVYLASPETNPDQFVAIKRIVQGGGAYHERFRREAQVLDKLTESGVFEIPALIEHIDDDMDPFIVMAYLHGNSLSIKETMHKPYTRSNRLRQLEDVAGTLARAHEMGIVHRDVKPLNIIIPKDHPNRGYLIDWGLAGTCESITPDGSIITDTTKTSYPTILGTPEYASPEVLSGEKATCASDVYSLGVTAYESLIGQLPRGTPSEQESVTTKLQRLLSRDITAPHIADPSISRSLSDLVMSCLERKPEHRPNSKEVKKGLCVPPLG